MSMRPVESIIHGRKLVTATRNTHVREAAQTMFREHVGAMLVVERDRLVGIFTERDALFRVLARGLDPDHTPLSKVMTSHPVTITPDKPLGHALHLMFEGGFRHVPVVRDGKPVGVVSARDALGSEMLEFESELKQRDDIAEHMR